MRTELQPLEGKRTTFFATFCRYGQFMTRYGMKQKVLLKNLRDSQYHELAGHISIANPFIFQMLGAVREGDIVRFTATVCQYVKGYRGNDIDLKMRYPISIDYGISDIRDLIKITIEPSRKSNHKVPDFEELKRNKRLVLGVS